MWWKCVLNSNITHNKHTFLIPTSISSYFQVLPWQEITPLGIAKENFDNGKVEVALKLANLAKNLSNCPNVDKYYAAYKLPLRRGLIVLTKLILMCLVSRIMIQLVNYNTQTIHFPFYKHRYNLDQHLKAYQGCHLMFKVNGIFSSENSIGSKGDKSVTLGTFKEGDLEIAIKNTLIPWEKTLGIPNKWHDSSGQTRKRLEITQIGGHQTTF